MGRIWLNRLFLRSLRFLGTVVPEVVGFLPVKVFLVPVEALEMAYREDLVE